MSSVPNPYAAYDAIGNIACRNTDTSTAYICDSSPTGAPMSYDSGGQPAYQLAFSGTVGSVYYLYSNKGNRVLTNPTNASTTTDTVELYLHIMPVFDSETGEEK